MMPALAAVMRITAASTATHGLSSVRSQSHRSGRAATIP